MNENLQQTHDYEPPRLTEVRDFIDLTRGQYTSEHSDDSDHGGYWSQPV